MLSAPNLDSLLIEIGALLIAGVIVFAVIRSLVR